MNVEFSGGQLGIIRGLLWTRLSEDKNNLQMMQARYQSTPTGDIAKWIERYKEEVDFIESILDKIDNAFEVLDAKR